MIKNTHPGLFIVFEGLDGSGSTVQASLLSGILSKEGYRVNLTKEPTNNLIGGLIKARLTGEWQTNGECLQLLFTADRAQHLTREIIPNLEAGRIVISDRYVFSSMAYASLEVGDWRWIEQINSRFIMPDLVFLIKVRPKICAIRMKENRHGMELFREEQKITKVWQTYEELVSHYKNIHLIDGERDEIEIIREIADITRKFLTSNPKYN